MAKVTLNSGKEKFTGGEWEVIEPLVDGKNWMVVVSSPTSDKLIASVGGVNAYLLSQSKNMYYMLKRIADDNRGFDDGFVDEIDDLLAKARGE